ncbi:TetR/AcrR family transcriptional regulator [Cellulomonas endophytica]|uniref:TetR/AcrR family transcriptional regulator n=1 Tax=Cellulomonas endophytica TaxID=2494735 RepID=UPI001012D4CF|nr:TetR/AcrR family transcriptional regulator [Cellulomonas endophytica]
MDGTGRDGTTAGRPLRRDARRNRERIVAAARELFAERGLDVGFNEIAHRAGVGVGTVYNRFADRDELVLAALEQPGDEVLALAGRARTATRAVDGLGALLEGAAAALAENLGLRSLVLTADPGVLPAVGGAISTVLVELLERAVAEGDVRPDVVVEDVRIALWMVTEVARHSAEVQPDLYRRYLQVVLDGLRAGSARGPLRVAPAPDLQDVSRHWAGLPRA